MRIKKLDTKNTKPAQQELNPLEQLAFYLLTDKILQEINFYLYDSYHEAREIIKGDLKALYPSKFASKIEAILSPVIYNIATKIYEEHWRNSSKYRQIIAKYPTFKVSTELAYSEIIRLFKLEAKRR